MEGSRVADVKPRILDTTEKSKSWKFPDISDPSQLKTLKLPDPMTPSKVCHVYHMSNSHVIFLRFNEYLCDKMVIFFFIVLILVIELKVQFLYASCNSQSMPAILSFTFSFLQIVRLLCELYNVLQVVRLLYTNSGMAVLALASNAIHKLWKWQRNERNPSGKVRI